MSSEAWVVVNIGCIECGVSSNIVAVYADRNEAERVAEHLDNILNWRQGGHNSFEVFPLPDVGVVNGEYREAMNSFPSERAQS